VTFVLETLRQQILDYANNNLPQNVVRGYVPQPADIVLTNGSFTPYIVLRFGDMAQGGGRSFIGARGDQYFMMLDFMCIASSPTLAEQVQSKVVDVMLGWKPDSAGQLNKMPGGSSFVIIDSDDKPLAFLANASFRISFNIV
jgi:hypothetical protein